jgi:hypothetical protein
MSQTIGPVEPLNLECPLPTGIDIALKCARASGIRDVIIGGRWELPTRVPNPEHAIARVEPLAFRDFHGCIVPGVGARAPQPPPRETPLIPRQVREQWLAPPAAIVFKARHGYADDRWCSTAQSEHSWPSGGARPHVGKTGVALADVPRYAMREKE